MFSTEIEIGGVGFGVETEDGELFAEVVGRYGGFPPAGPPGIRMRVETEPNPPGPPWKGGDSAPPFQGGPGGADAPDVVVQPLESPLAYRLVSSYLEGRLDLGSGEAVARVTSSVYGFDSLLRAALTLDLVRQQGFLLHSAGLMREGRAYLFFGVSGAGKTTVACQASGPILLSDEIVAVRGGEGGFRAHGTPFSGEMAVPGEPVSGPIAALFRLGRPPGPTLERLQPAAAARSLLRCVLYYGGHPPDTQALLETCLDLASSVPCYHLRLRLEVPVWEQLHGLE